MIREKLMIRASQESQPSDVVRCWLCIMDGLPLSCAFALLSGLLCLPEVPGACIGFYGHFPCKVALEILLRHSTAASLEVIIPFPSLADGPLSVVVDVSSVCVLFLKSCLSPHQHALFPSEITKGERDFQIISHARRRGRGASGRNSGTIRSR